MNFFLVENGFVFTIYLHEKIKVDGIYLHEKIKVDDLVPPSLKMSPCPYCELILAAIFYLGSCRP